jgi:hypothetical protein
MAGKRTSGMAALGAVHIVVGALGALASLAVVLVEGLVALAPSVLDLSKLPMHMSAVRSTAIALLVVGLVRAAMSVLLIVAGIRVLDVAPAGRRLSLVAAFGWTFMNVFEAIAMSEPLWWFLASTAYPLVTEWLFLRKDWRTAFSRPSPLASSESSVSSVPSAPGP